jgi:hypothetical protein
MRIRIVMINAMFPYSSVAVCRQIPLAQSEERPRRADPSIVGSQGRQDQHSGQCFVVWK